jgi:DNA-binding CsgD family transcriptional regulator
VSRTQNQGHEASTASVNDGQSDVAKPSDLLRVLAVVGFACLLAGFISSIFAVGPALQPYAGQTNLDLALFSLLGLFMAQLLSYTSFVEQSPPQRLVIRSLVFSALFAVVVLAMVLDIMLPAVMPWPLTAVAWFALGVLMGILLPIWGNVWTALDTEHADTRQTTLIIAWSALAAAVVCVFNVFAPTLIIAVAVLVFFVASLVLLAWCTRWLPSPVPISINISKQRLSILSRNLLPPLLLTTLLSALLCYWSKSAASSVFFLALLAAIAAAALVLALLLIALKRLPHFSTIERWVIGVCALALAALFINSPTLSFIVSLIAVAALVFYLLGHWSVLVALSYRHKVLTLYHYAQGLIAPLGGLALGWLLTDLLLALSGHLGAEAVALYLPIIFLPALILTVCIVPFTSYTLVEGLFVEDDAKVGQTKASYWQRKMQQVSTEARLSPREIEVFALLAKGRNAEHIAKTLFISTHTVKTHVYRIYRKLGVNTQQELIEKVDSLRF